METGIILFAHGSRDPHWREPIEAIALDLKRRQADAAVCCAYLENCLPSLPQAAAELVAGGVTRLRIFPLFLGLGKHAREDLPELMQQLRQAHPGVAIELIPAAGEHPEVTQLLADIALSGGQA